MRNRIAMGIWLGVAALAAQGCSADASETAEHSPTTAVEGEKLSSLSSELGHLSGVFVKNGESLVFDVNSDQHGSALRLSTIDGEELYSVVTDARGSEMRVGRGFHSFLPASAAKAASRPRNASPMGFDSSGDLRAELQALKRTPFALLPALGAALGRRGFDGRSSRPAMQIDLLALEFTQQGILELDRATAAATNRLFSGNDDVVAPAAPALNTSDGVGVKSSALSDACNSGVGRRALGDMRSDPCEDDCFGMCGPGCTSWDWLCGDSNVHALCWQHDSAFCPDASIFNLDYDACMAVYVVFSGEVAGDAKLDNCEEDVSVPWPLWRSHPDFYETFGTPPAPRFDGAPFDVSDSRYFTDSGDWSVNDLKAECPADAKVVGLSATAYNPEIHAHSVLCASTPETFVRTGFGLTTHNLDGADDRADFGTGDWDVGYTKAECGVGEAITGVSQTGDLKLRKVECSWIESESGNNDQACTPLVFSNSADNRMSGDPGDWAIGYVKNQCRSNQYLKGISSNAATGEIHALLCCDSTPYPH